MGLFRDTCKSLSATSEQIACWERDVDRWLRVLRILAPLAVVLAALSLALKLAGL